MKKCSKCGVVKALSHFNAFRASKDGVRPDCKECKRADDKRYREENQDKRDAWNRSNSKMQSAWLKEYRATDNGKEVLRRKDQKRRAARRNAIVEECACPETSVLVAFYGKACLFPGCNKAVPTLDHVTALYNGGKHTYWNTQPLCRSHNSSKRDWHSTDYREGHNPWGILMDRVMT